jgi:hypothetical protein
MTRWGLVRIGVLVAFAALLLSVASAQAGNAPTYIAFVRDSNTSPAFVWIANANGSGARKLAKGSQASISPDGATVAVSGAGGSSGPALELYSTSGKAEHGFFPGAKVGATVLAWTFDSRFLLVSLLSTGVSAKGSGLEVVDTSDMKSWKLASGVIYGGGFDPTGTEVVYASSASQNENAPVNVHTVGLDGGQPQQITSEGHSLEPLFVKGGILFDFETSRGVNKAPAYQLWLYTGSHFKQLTHMKIPALQDGLVPMQASSDGNHIIASFGGEDTYNTWAVQISPFKAKEIMVDGKTVQPAGISSDGQQLLVTLGGFEGPADGGSVVSVGFNGGNPTTLVKGAAALSWNQEQPY